MTTTTDPATQPDDTNPQGLQPIWVRPQIGHFQVTLPPEVTEGLEQTSILRPATGARRAVEGEPLTQLPPPTSEALRSPRSVRLGWVIGFGIAAMLAAFGLGGYAANRPPDTLPSIMITETATPSAPPLACTQALDAADEAITELEQDGGADKLVAEYRDAAKGCRP